MLVLNAGIFAEINLKGFVAFTFGFESFWQHVLSACF